MRRDVWGVWTALEGAEKGGKAKNLEGGALRRDGAVQKAERCKRRRGGAVVGEAA